MGVGRQIANNAMWKYLELVSVTGIQLVTTFVMARFLSPEDYGVMGLVTVFTVIANVIVDSGFGQAVIREKEVTRGDYSSILYFNLLISVILYLLLYLFSGIIADIFRKPILEEISKVTFLVLPMNALSIVQITKMQRDLKFKKLCIISLVSLLMASSVAIGFVYFYRNVWALVLLNLLIYFFKMLLLWITTDFIPLVSFSIESLKKYFGFSKNLMISALIATLFNNIYSIVIGRAYSTADLGFYSQADRLKNLASQTATQVVQSVTYPFMSRINNENGDIKELYKKIISIALVSVGFLMAVLIGSSLDLFEMLMGNPEWRTAGFYFMLMGVNGILFPLHCINQNVIMVKGDSGTILRLEIFRRIIMILIVVLTIKSHISVFVFGLTIYSVLLLFVNLYYCGKPIDYTVYEQLRDTLPIFVRLFVMVAVSLGIGCLMKSSPMPIRLAATLSIGCFSGLLLFWNQKDFKAIFSVLLSFLKTK